MFECTLCGAILEPHECIVTQSDELCEIYVSCPYCHGECESYKEEQEDEKILLECMECGAVFHGCSGKYELEDRCPYCGGCYKYNEDQQYYEEVIVNVAHI